MHVIIIIIIMNSHDLVCSYVTSFGEQYITIGMWVRDLYVGMNKEQCMIQNECFVKCLPKPKLQTTHIYAKSKYGICVCVSVRRCPHCNRGKYVL